MKTLSVQYVSGMAGSERYLLTLLPGLKRLGTDAEMLIIVHPRVNPAVERLIGLFQNENIRIHVLKARFGFSPLVVLNFARLVRREAYDIVQSNLIRADLLVAIASRWFPTGTKIVSVKHGYSETYTKRHGFDPSAMRLNTYSILTRWAAAKSDAVVAVSKAIRDLLVKGGLVEADKTLTIHLGIKIVDADRAVEGLARFSDLQILLLGRLVAYKQHHLVLRAMPDLIRRFPSVGLVVVGDGPLREQLVAEADRLGILPHVRWEGYRTDVPAYLVGSDVMIVPSASEGFGLVILEAWLHSLPVVAFDVPAPNEIIVNDESGILMPPFEVALLVEGVARLLSDPELRTELGRRGRERLSSHFDEELMIRSSNELFRRIRYDNVSR